MPLLSREEITGAQDLPIEVVDVPEWGVDAQVGVRVMTGKEHAEFTSKILALTEADILDQRALLCSLTIVGADGQRLFASDEVELLGAKSSQVLERLYEVACRLNVLREQDREALKKSEAPTDISGSSSLDTSAVAL